MDLSTETTSQLPPVAAKDPVERLGEVVKGKRKSLDQYHSQFHAAVDTNQQTAELAGLNEEVTVIAQAKKAIAEYDKAALEGKNEEARKKFLGLGRLLGEKDRKQAEIQASDTYKQAEQLYQTGEQLNEKLQQKLGQSADEVIQLRDLMVRTQDLIDANLRGGPFEVSPQMTEALDKQDAKVIYAKLDMGEIPTERMLTTGEIHNVRDVLVESNSLRYGKNKTYTELRTTEKEEVDGELKSIASIYEAALEYADKNKISVNQELLLSAVRRGIYINNIKDREWGQVLDFAREKALVDNNGAYFDNRDADWVYCVGSYILEGFLKQKSIAFEQAAPYIIAFAAGVNSSPSAMPKGLGEALRGWVADTVPVPEIEYVREDGKFVPKPKNTTPEPRGLGSLMKLQRGEGHYTFPMLMNFRWEATAKTSNEGVANAMNTALEVVNLVNGKLRERHVPWNKIDGRSFDSQKEVVYTPPQA